MHGEQGEERGKTGRSARQDRRCVDEACGRTPFRGHLDPRHLRRSRRDARRFPRFLSVQGRGRWRPSRVASTVPCWLKTARSWPTRTRASACSTFSCAVSRRWRPIARVCAKRTHGSGASRRAALAMNPVVTRIDALHARSGGDRARGRRGGSDQASGPGARLGAHRRGVAGRRRSRPVEDDGRARPRIDPRRTGGCRESIASAASRRRSGRWRWPPWRPAVACGERSHRGSRGAKGRGSRASLTARTRRRRRSPGALRSRR